jgi:hypothetical protein
MSKQPYETKPEKVQMSVSDFLKYLVKEESLYRLTIIAHIGEDGFNQLLSNGFIKKDLI